jgi:hypothetical protein
MTVIRPERLNANDSGSEKSGPEKYAPARRVPEKLADVAQAAATSIEGEIRDLVRRDTAFPQGQHSEGDAGANRAAENLNALIGRVAGASIEEIDRVILELEGVRAMLRSEGERVSREIAGYASLCHASTTAMTVIGDSLKQWKVAPGKKNSERLGN